MQLYKVNNAYCYPIELSCDSCQKLHFPLVHAIFISLPERISYMWAKQLFVLNRGQKYSTGEYLKVSYETRFHCSISVHYSTVVKCANIVPLTRGSLYSIMPSQNYNKRTIAPNEIPNHSHSLQWCSTDCYMV